MKPCEAVPSAPALETAAASLGTPTLEIRFDINVILDPKRVRTIAFHPGQEGWSKINY